MLKIKDNVDLKELEKYGFITEKCGNGENTFYDKTKEYEKYDYGFLINDYNDENNRTIGYYFNNLEDVVYQDINHLDTHSLDTLYDLIKADLVEKVDE